MGKPQTKKRIGLKDASKIFGAIFAETIVVLYPLQCAIYSQGIWDIWRGFLKDQIPHEGLIVALIRWTFGWILTWTYPRIYYCT